MADVTPKGPNGEAKDDDQMDMAESRSSVVKPRERKLASLQSTIRNKGISYGLVEFFSNPERRPWLQVPREDFGPLRGVIFCSWAGKAISFFIGMLIIIFSISKMTRPPSLLRQVQSSNTEEVLLPPLAIDSRDYKGMWKPEIRSCSILNGNPSTKKCVVETDRLKPCKLEIFREQNGKMLEKECLCFNGPNAHKARPDNVYWTVQGIFGAKVYTYNQLAFVYTGPGDGTFSNGTAGVQGKVSLYFKDLTASDREPQWSQMYYKWQTGFSELVYEMFFRPVKILDTSWHGVTQEASKVSDIAKKLTMTEVSARRTDLSYLRVDPWSNAEHDWKPNGSVTSSSSRQGIVFIFRSGLSNEELTVDYFSLVDMLAEIGGVFNSTATIVLTVVLAYVAIANLLHSRGMISRIDHSEEERPLKKDEVHLMARLINTLFLTDALNPMQTEQQQQTVLNHLELRKIDLDRAETETAKLGLDRV